MLMIGLLLYIGQMTMPSNCYVPLVMIFYLMYNLHLFFIPFLSQVITLIVRLFSNLFLFLIGYEEVVFLIKKHLFLAYVAAVLTAHLFLAN